ncbi:Indoleacetamide hydrolase [Rhodococcus sp. B7740]|uniref:amidase family protein n=1 Tax=Rhodococcus sp. B7740 TaxID=1564114 RepID=UPI0005DA53A6|nr:amidase family protein [Rhodococcus sp. B7740]AJW40294.1 Indoleacetamide hydrolase [Rhodococcus sp. B7740]
MYGHGAQELPTGTAAGVPLFDLTIVETRYLLATGRLDARSYAAGLRRRTTEVVEFNTMTTTLPTPAPSGSHECSGPLGGIPLVVKDSIDVAGTDSTAGTPGLVGNTAVEDAEIVRRLVAAGGHVSGKNVMHELALGATSNNALHGPVRNPWNTSLTAGGSSGGTAAAVALGNAPAGIGTDTGGSVRIPAALCGVIGFRPSVGRYPAEGIVSLSHTRDTSGPIARSIEDILLLDSVLAQRPSIVARDTARGLRIGLTPAHGQDLHPDVEAAYERVRNTLAAAGVTFVDVDIDDIMNLTDTIAASIVWGEAADGLGGYLRSRGLPGIETVLAAVSSPDVRRVVAEGLGATTAHSYRRNLAVVGDLRHELANRMSSTNIDAFMFPTTPVVAPPLGQDDTIELNRRRVPTFSTIIRHGDLGGTLGLPGISIPVGLGATSALPVGIEFSSATGTDERLLASVASLAPHIIDLHRPSTIPAPLPARN